MWTTEGFQRLFEIATGQSEDSFVGGRIVVTDGTQEASVVIDEWPWATTVEEDGDTFTRLSVSARFESDVANFVWAERRVVTKEGVIIDRVTKDFGRKAPGAEWTMQVDLDLRALPEE